MHLFTPRLSSFAQPFAQLAARRAPLTLPNGASPIRPLSKMHFLNASLKETAFLQARQVPSHTPTPPPVVQRPLPLNPEPPKHVKKNDSQKHIKQDPPYYSSPVKSGNLPVEELGHNYTIDDYLKDIDDLGNR